MKNLTDLSNTTVLVTRPGSKGQALCATIAARGGRAIYFPTIAFAPPPDPQAFQQAIGQLGEQDWLIFISPQAVSASLPALRQRWSRLPDKVRCAAIGEGTATALRNAGFTAIFPAQAYNSESLLALAEFQHIEDSRIAVIRGLGGREEVDRILAERGATVLSVIAYQRSVPVVDSEAISHMLKQNEIAVAVCTSFDSVKNLKILLGEPNWQFLQSLPLLVLSERIKMLAQDLGFQRIWVTKQASETAILAALADMKDSL